MTPFHFNSFRCAFAGIVDLLKSQPNARIHLLAAALAVAAGFFFSLSPTEWYFVLAAIAFVFAAEAFNTALEYLTNLVSPEYHPLAGKAKDAAAGAVLIAAICSAIIGGLIFLPKIISWLR